MGVYEKFPTIFSVTSIGFMLFLIIALFLNFSVATTLHRNYEIGKRTQASCGKEVTEYETGRYAIYRTFLEGTSVKKPIVKTINGSNIMTRSAMALVTVITIICIVVVAFKFHENVKSNVGTWKYWFIYVALLFSWVMFTFTSAFGMLGSAIQTSQLSGISKLLNVTQDVNPTDEINSLYGQSSFAKVISAAWFTFGITYGVALLYLYSIKNGLEQDTSLLYKPIWFLAGIYIVAVILSSMWERNLKRLYSAINVKYFSRVKELKTSIVSLTTTTNTAVLNKVKAYFKQNIERVLNIEVAADTVLTDYANDLWKFIIHTPNQEMKEIYAIANKLNVTSAKAAIANIRKDMLKIRMTSSDLDKSVKGYVRNTMWTSGLLVATAVYLVFHLFLSPNHMHTVVYSALFLLFIMIAGTVFGWISSTLTL